MLRKELAGKVMEELNSYWVELRESMDNSNSACADVERFEKEARTFFNKHFDAEV